MKKRYKEKKDQKENFSCSWKFLRKQGNTEI
jgi:hypothetical protein